MGMSAFGEQDIGAQRFKAVATAKPVHDANQAVQAFGVGIGDRMIEVGNDVLVRGSRESGSILIENMTVAGN